VFTTRHTHAGLRRVWLPTSALLLIVALAGCSGGGSGPAPATTEQAPTPQNNPAPAISSVSPSSAPVGASSTTVTITGSGFVQGSVVEWNQSNRPTTFVSSTELQVTVSSADLASAGTAQISVMNPSPGGGSSATSAFSINNPAPSITSLSQTSTMAGSAATVITITGTGFVPASIAQWNQSNRPTTFVSSTQLQVTFTAADLAFAGIAQITVVNPGPGGGASVGGGFTVNNPVPAISSLSQTSTTAGSAATVISITGTGFVAASMAQWNAGNRPTTFVSSTQLQVALTAADLAVGEIAQITVLNPAPGGGTSTAATLTINNPLPDVAGISPSTVTIISGGSALTVTGTGFLPNSSITWNGANRTTKYVNGTQLQLTLQASDLASVGTAQIGVSNPAPGGGVSATSQPLTINYPPPVITSLSPSGAFVNGPAFTLTVNGFGFGPTSVVAWNGTNCATTYVNSSQLTCQIPASNIAAVGTAQITVFTPAPGGGTSNSIALNITTFPPVTLSSISPSSVSINSPDTVVSIAGSGFTVSSTMQVNGGSPIAVLGASPIAAFFTIPAADLTVVGQLSITVSNPGTAPSNALTVDVVPNPIPTLSQISPGGAAFGGPGITLTVSGSNFVPTSVVQWNGSARATTFVGPNQLTASISAKDIQTLGNSAVTVFNPAPGGGTSGALTFTTFISLPTNDLTYSSFTGLLYASVPSSGGPSLGNSIVSIDPNTGIMGAPIFVCSEPTKMAISSDGKVIWVSLNGAAAVRQVDLVAQTAGLQFSLGGGTGIYNPPATAQALAVMPGSPNTLAVAAPVNFVYASSVTIYDSGKPRANAVNGAVQCCSGVTGLAFDPTGTKLYEAGSGYGVATVDSTGITSATSLNINVSSNGLRVDNGRAYLTTGVILDANTGMPLGVFSVGQNQNANGPEVPDSSIGKAFVLLNPNFGPTLQVNAYDISTFVLDGSLPAVNVNSYGPPSPASLARWGQDGLAFSNGSQLYILHSALVRDLSSSLADLSVTASASAAATTGTSLTYSLTVTNAGPATATPATLTDDIPDGSVFQSATSTQGSCSGGAVVHCDLGNLNSGSSASVQITVTLLTSGTLNNTATVSAPQGDPNLANNTVTTATTVTGPTYSPAPMVSSISPAFVQAGSASFTLTITGSGFVSGSVVQMNGTALSTTFVSATQLTANVDASNVATMGWAWINVANPSPGGGTSSSSLLTTYQVVSLDVNRMGFDPFTRKLYATVPSTASQVTGNSLVAIDPTSGSLGSPLNIGSEPNRISESSDGQYLYVGLDGAQSVTNVDLTTMKQGPVYPIVIPGSPSPNTQVSARDLAVAPGNNSVLAIDTGSWGGDGIFDFTSTSGSMRTNVTGPYTGSNLAFANGTTFYSYDSDTTGAEFNRWTITSSGPARLGTDTTGFTLNGIGGFSGSFKLANGIVYGFAGGVADPTTTPPTQLGQFYVSSSLGSSQVVQGSGVAPDPASGRVFILGQTLAGSANPVLLSYDSSRYVLLNQLQLTGLAQGVDLLRWGRDGLAWHTSLGYPFGGTTGTGKIILMRGPFVLPQWSSANSTPALSSASPSSATAGGGNLVLTVTGSGFVPGAVVTWNGAERTSTFVDSSHLTVAIPVSDIANSGNATLAVNNPNSGNSNSISFPIN